MASGTLSKGDLKTVMVSKTVTVAADSSVMGGYYAFVGIGAEIEAAVGSDWNNKVLSVIPLSAVSTSVNGLGGLLSDYFKSGYHSDSFALAAPREGSYLCEFSVFYR